jgi:hypothetical protein
VLAVFREALSNAARHAQASQVEVSVEAGSDLVCGWPTTAPVFRPASAAAAWPTWPNARSGWGGTLQVGLPMRMQEPERCRSGGCASAAGSARSAVIGRSPSAVTNPAQCG